MFVIFINDLPEQVNSEIFLFADDTKIFRNMKDSDDKNTLQRDVDTMLKCADQWRLEFHPDKCVSLSINNKEGSNRTCRMKDIELKQVKYEKDIGVIIYNQLKIENHMNEKIKKANNMMELIRRSFVHLDEAMFIKLYKALVHAHMEIQYGNPTRLKI